MPCCASGPASSSNPLRCKPRLRLTIELPPPTTFERFDTATNTMRIMPGHYELMYGGSSADADLQVLPVQVME